MLSMQCNIALMTRIAKKRTQLKKEYANTFSLSQWTNSIVFFKISVNKMRVLYSTKKPLKILILHKQKITRFVVYENQRFTDITISCSIDETVPFHMHCTLL